MQIVLTNSQGQFFNSKKKFSAFVGGYGSGKTYVGIVKAIAFITQNVGKNVCYYLPTYPLIRDIAFPRFSALFDMLEINYVLNKSDKVFSTKYGDIFLRSMDNHNLIVGYEVGYSVIDEADVLPRTKMDEAFTKIVARNRQQLPDGSDNCIDFVSTPEGFGFLYDFFVKKESINKILINGKTSENKHLPKGYIDTLRESYTEQQLRAYLNGEFVNLSSGTVYNSFDRIANHSPREIKANDILHIGIDFNIGNMSAVIRVIDEDVSIAVDEIVKAYDTYQLCELIKDRYSSYRIFVYPDASGGSRKTSSGTSDFQVIQSFGFKIMSGKTNPSVRDRITTANVSFQSKKAFVNTFKCPALTESYEKLAYKNDVPDKNSGFDHLTDADTYSLFFLNYKRNTKMSSFVF